MVAVAIFATPVPTKMLVSYSRVALSGMTLPHCSVIALWRQEASHPGRKVEDVWKRGQINQMKSVKTEWWRQITTCTTDRGNDKQMLRETTQTNIQAPDHEITLLENGNIHKTKKNNFDNKTAKVSADSAIVRRFCGERCKFISVRRLSSWVTVLM